MLRPAHIGFKPARLGKQMKLASFPEEMHRIGSEEGRIGAEQAQSVVSREQSAGNKA